MAERRDWHPFPFLLAPFLAPFPAPPTGIRPASPASALRLTAHHRQETVPPTRWPPAETRPTAPPPVPAEATGQASTPPALAGQLCPPRAHPAPGTVEHGRQFATSTSRDTAIASPASSTRSAPAPPPAASEINASSSIPQACTRNPPSTTRCTARTYGTFSA